VPESTPGRALAPDFLSEADCAALMRRILGLTRYGGDTAVNLESVWLGNVHWARNRISGAGETRTNRIELTRIIRGGSGKVKLDAMDEAALEQAVRLAEHESRFQRTQSASDLRDDYQEPITHPKIWFDTTYHVDVGQRADMVRRVIEPIEQAGMVAAGYLEVKAVSRSVQSSRVARKPLYYSATAAQFSLTVRDPQGTGSGWAGVDWSDWSRIDAMQLAQTALDKCLRSRNPVRLEPGRYTVILEPQAVGDLMNLVFMMLGPGAGSTNRVWSENGSTVFAGRTAGTTKIGMRVFDPRITITEDPMDPDLGFLPFEALEGEDRAYSAGTVFNPVTWVENGVLQQLAYTRDLAIRGFHRNRGMPHYGAFHMSGGPTSVSEMIQSTPRGLYVTRFSTIEVLNFTTLLCVGYTRDGLWLIENGQLTKPVKNFRFTESPMFVFNQVEQLGVPQRVFHPIAPIVVPPVKVRDFSFTSLTDAV
jgi:predicted Zn-dependent protease